MADTIMALGAEYMQRLRAHEEETHAALVAFLGNFIHPLKAELGPGFQVVPKETQKTWRYFTALLAHCPGVNTEAHAAALVDDLHRKIKALEPNYEVNKVALEAFPLSNGTVMAYLLF